MLVDLGLEYHYRVRLTENRSVLVSFTESEVRVHRGYLDAPRTILSSIVRFVQARTRRERLDARRGLLSWKIASPPQSPRGPWRKPDRTHADDDRLARALAREHAVLNASKFDGELLEIPIRVSRRMKSRLGHYTWRGQSSHDPEIVISRRHIRRDGWDETLHTLLHEMVHQWQDERGLKVDHGREFRVKAKAVGITPLARRDVVSVVSLLANSVVINS